MKKSLLAALCASSLLLSRVPARAQNTRPVPSLDQGVGEALFGGPRGDERDFGRGPRDNGRMSLQRAWRGVGTLSGAEALSTAQAKRMVALVLPWSKRPTLSQSDAQKLSAQITAVLSDAQKRRLSAPRGGMGHGPERGGDFGGGGFGGGDFGRGPRRDDVRGEGRRAGFGGPARDAFGSGSGRAFLTTFNPFYAPTGYAAWKQLPTEQQQLLSRRYRENRATLEALSRRAKGAKVGAVAAR